MVDGPTRGLELVESLGSDGPLDSYLFFHSTKADLLRRLGRMQAACESYRRALELAGNASERRFLEKRLRECDG